ncbi:MAG: 1-acyl-sn-glycerol-3-phosphate acyltransferase [Novosphingobium sp.]|nr:1-acyl-sn-glycerol-3-phosphate acyltransferase [Novosphingobium sp.]
MSAILSVLRSLLFYVVFYTGTVPIVVAAMMAVPLGRRPLRFMVAVWTLYHRYCVNLLLGIRVRIEGELPEGGVLVAMKHESFFEAIDLPVLFRNPVVFAKAELLAIPMWGHAAKAYDMIAVDRDQGAKALRSMLKLAKERVSPDRVLVIFPEGTRVPHGAPSPLRSGFAGLYKLLGLPVVPVAVNSGPLYHRRWKRSGTITVKVGEAVPAGLAREEAEARVIAAMNALNDSHMLPEPLENPATPR